MEAVSCNCIKMVIGLNGIQLSPNVSESKTCLEFWIPRHGSRMLSTGFRILCQLNLRFPIPLAEFRIPKPGFRILQAKSSRIPLRGMATRSVIIRVIKQFG